MRQSLLIYDPLDASSRIARATLLEFGAPHRCVVISATFANDHIRPWFARLNPTMRTPILIKDDVAHWSLAAIEKALAKDAGRAAGLGVAESWLAEKLQLFERDLGDAFASPAARWFLRRELHRRIAFLSSEISRSPEMQYLYAAKRVKIEERLSTLDNERAAEERLRHVDKLFSKFERHMSAREFVSGNNWTMVDAIWTACIDRLRSLGFGEIVNGERHPHTNDYLGRMRRRASFRLLHLSTAGALAHAASQMFRAATPRSDAPPALVKQFSKMLSSKEASVKGIELTKSSGGAI